MVREVGKLVVTERESKTIKDKSKVEIAPKSFSKLLKSTGGGSSYTEPSPKKESEQPKPPKQDVRTVEPAPTAEGLEGVRQRLQHQRRTIERTPEEKRTIKQKTKLTLLGLASSGVGTAQAVAHPVQTVKGTGSAVKETFRFLTGQRKDTPFGFIGSTLKQSPEYSIGFAGGEFLTLKGGQKLLTKVPPIVERELTKLSPNYQKLRTNSKGQVVIDVPSESGGFKQITLGGTVSEIQESLSSQAKLAGKKVDAVSASKGIFNAFKRKKEIDKPRPPDAPPLEETFFADPRGRLRPSRLGLTQEEARLIDILSGDFTFKRSRPQALFFEDITIAKFPSSLRGIKMKLLRGIPLNRKEHQRLLRFQLTPSGEFKPIGFLSREPEIVLSKGEIIRRKATPVVVIIKGRRVPIIRTEIIKDAGLSELFIKFKRGLATPGDIKKLTKGTGLDFSSPLVNKRLLRPSIAGISGRRSPKTYPTSLKRVSKPFSKPIGTSITRSIPSAKSGIKRSTLKAPPSILSKSKKSPISSKPFVRPTVKRLVPIGKSLGKSSSDFLKKRIKRDQSGISKVDVYTFRGGKPTRITPKPILSKFGKDYGSFHVGKTLRGSFFTRPSYRSGLMNVPDRMKGSFKRLRSQFRPSKTKKGVLVEKSKFRLSHPVEVKDIQLSRRKK